MSAERGSFADYRARLDALGFRPSSARGQNFLLDPTLHRWIADAAALSADDVVLEIGVGLGFLTRELAARAGRVVGVEIDRRLYEVARQELRSFANVDLLHADALGGPQRSFPGEVVAGLAAARAALVAAGRAPRLLVVANLPYSVSGALMAELTAMVDVPDRAVVLVQRELAERFAATVGSGAYGGLSAALQATFAVRVLRTVSPEVFRPRPKVGSAVVQLDRRPDLPMPGVAARRRFGAFVRQLFAQRRKVLRTTLPRALAAAADGAAPPVDLLARLGDELLGRRAEELGADELMRLCALLD